MFPLLGNFVGLKLFCSNLNHFVILCFAVRRFVGVSLISYYIDMKAVVVVVVLVMLVGVEVVIIVAVIIWWWGLWWWTLSRW